MIEEDTVKRDSNSDLSITELLSAPRTHQLLLAEEQEGGLELVLLGFGHGQVFESGLGDGHVQTLR